jgi:hypothetical protein
MKLYTLAVISTCTSAGTRSAGIFTRPIDNGNPRRGNGIGIVLHVRHAIRNEIVNLGDAPKVKRVVKLLPLPQPPMRASTYAQTNPSAQRATQLRSVLARVYSVSRQNLNTTTVP